MTDAGRGDPTRLRRRFRPVPDWDQARDGSAPRLGPRDRIEVTRVGRFRSVDPYRTAEGWRDPGKSLGFGLWCTVVGIAWWIGSSRGRGPLKPLAADRRRPSMRS